MDEIQDIVQALLYGFDEILVQDLHITDTELVQWFSASMTAIVYVLVIATGLCVFASAFLAVLRLLFGGARRA